MEILKSNFEEDILYNSLRRLSNMTAMSTTRMRKIRPVVIPYINATKNLTFSVNDAVFTNGNESDLKNDEESNFEHITHLIKRRDLYKKLSRQIGTCLENCSISDSISIDIEPESTKLPMMCKLMIIVEGAIYERGTRVLVRDASIQVDNGGDYMMPGTYIDENANYVSVNEKNLTATNSVKIKKDEKSSLLDENDLFYEKSIYIPTITTSTIGCNQSTHKGEKGKENFKKKMARHRSTDSLVKTFDDNKISLNFAFNSEQQQQFNKNNDNFLIKNSQNINRNCREIQKTHYGGSLNSLASSYSNESSVTFPFVTIPIFNESSNYFNKTKREQHLQSYLDMYEYTSIPYYQYQLKDNSKKDFSTDTAELYEYVISNCGNQRLLNYHPEHCDEHSKQLNKRNCRHLYHHCNHQHHHVNCRPFEDHEHIEIQIPIRLSPRSYLDHQHCFNVIDNAINKRIHKNEKHIILTKENNFSSTNDECVLNSTKMDESLNTVSEKMRNFLDERINRFEAEITFFNLGDQTRSLKPIISFKPLFNDVYNSKNNQENEVFLLNQPSIEYSYNCFKTRSSIENNNKNLEKNLILLNRSKPSVTHLIFLQVKNGHLIE